MQDFWTVFRSDVSVFRGEPTNTDEGEVGRITETVAKNSGTKNWT